LKRPIIHVPPILQEDGIWGTTWKEKAAAFVAHLSNLFTTPKTTANRNTVHAYLDIACPMPLPIPPFSTFFLFFFFQWLYSPL
jgi:hypothetical protein